MLTHYWLTNRFLSNKRSSAKAFESSFCRLWIFIFISWVFEVYRLISDYFSLKYRLISSIRLLRTCSSSLITTYQYLLHSFSYYSGDLYFKKLFLLAYCYNYEIVRFICSEVFLIQVLIDSIYSRTWFYWMISVRTRMNFDTFRTHEFQAYSLCAEVCNGFSPMIQAGYEISEICFHIFDAESFVHNAVIILYCLKFIYLSNIIYSN